MSADAAETVSQEVSILAGSTIKAAAWLLHFSVAVHCFDFIIDSKMWARNG